MAFRSPYQHAAPVCTYPTIEVMRDAYLEHRYADYPRCPRARLGPVPESEFADDPMLRPLVLECRTIGHALVLLPRRTLLLQFARRCTVEDVGRIDVLRSLVRRTPELEAVASWRIEARIVYCDVMASVKETAAERDVKLSLYLPRLLLNWRGRSNGSTLYGSRAMKHLDAEAVARFAAGVEAAKPGRVAGGHAVGATPNGRDAIEQPQRSERAGAIRSSPIAS